MKTQPWWSDKQKLFQHIDSRILLSDLDFLWGVTPERNKIYNFLQPHQNRLDDIWIRIRKIKQKIDSVTSDHLKKIFSMHENIYRDYRTQYNDIKNILLPSPSWSQAYETEYKEMEIWSIKSFNSTENTLHYDNAIEKLQRLSQTLGSFEEKIKELEDAFG